MSFSLNKYGFIAMAFAVAVLLWVFEAAVHVIAFKDGSFFEQLATLDINERWMRCTISFLILSFGIYIQIAFNRQKQQFETLKQMSRMFQTMVESMVGASGKDFFQNTVRGLCDFLSADCAIISDVDKGRVRALAMQLDGSFVDGFEYDLKGTPCSHAVKNGYSIFPEGVCQQFPEDEDLLQLRAEGYIGTPIRDKRGNAVGILCVISRQKLVVTEWTKSMFDIIAAKAGAEIENRRAIEHSEQLLARNRHLTRKLISAQEEERHKLARDLHDEIGQTLTALQSHMALAGKHSRSSQVIRHISSAQEITAHMFSIVHSMLENLQSTSIDEGLREAVVRMIEGWQKRNGIDCTYQIDSSVDYLDYEMAVCCFRLVQEALTNIAKHAKAGHVSVVMELNKQQSQEEGESVLCLQISDDGCGMEGIQFGMGLTGMSERVHALHGRFQLDSSSDKGTLISAAIPVFGKLNG